MHRSTDAVAAEVAHHAASFATRERRDGRADITEASPVADDSNACIAAAPGDVHEVTRLLGSLAYDERRRGIAVVALEACGDVDVDDVAVAEDVGPSWNAMADDGISARTDCGRE